MSHAGPVTGADLRKVACNPEAGCQLAFVAVIVIIAHAVVIGQAGPFSGTDRRIVACNLEAGGQLALVSEIVLIANTGVRVHAVAVWAAGLRKVAQNPEAGRYAAIRPGPAGMAIADIYINTITISGTDKRM